MPRDKPGVPLAVLTSMSILVLHEAEPPLWPSVLDSPRLTRRGHRRHCRVHFMEGHSPSTGSPGEAADTLTPAVHLKCMCPHPRFCGWAASPVALPSPLTSQEQGASRRRVWACPPEKWGGRGRAHLRDLSASSGALASPGTVQGPSLLVTPSSIHHQGHCSCCCPPQAQSSPQRQALSSVLPLHHIVRRRRAPAHLFDNMVITEWDSSSPLPHPIQRALGLSGMVSSKGQEMQGVSSD